MVAAAAAAARRAASRSMVGFNYRRVPALALARELIAEGRIGTVRQVRAAYLQDWLADAAAPMTWRLRQETAGSGALGDLGLARGRPGALPARRAGHLGVSGQLRHLRRRARPGADGPEPVTVDDAAWATLRDRARARWPASRSAGWPPAARTA